MSPDSAPLSRLVSAARWIVGVGAATAVVLLFTLESRETADAPTLASEVDRMVDAGEVIYAARCS